MLASMTMGSAAIFFDDCAKLDASSAQVLDYYINRNTEENWAYASYDMISSIFLASIILATGGMVHFITNNYINDKEYLSRFLNDWNMLMNYSLVVSTMIVIASSVTSYVDQQKATFEYNTKVIRDNGTAAREKFRAASGYAKNIWSTSPSLTTDDEKAKPFDIASKPPKYIEQLYNNLNSAKSLLDKCNALLNTAILPFPMNEVLTHALICGACIACVVTLVVKADLFAIIQNIRKMNAIYNKADAYGHVSNKDRAFIQQIEDSKIADALRLGAAIGAIMLAIFVAKEFGKVGAVYKGGGLYSQKAYADRNCV
jgi:hypothetical protein